MAAASDLHAADARYHTSCRVSFMSSKSARAALKVLQEDHEDESLQAVIGGPVKHVELRRITYLIYGVSCLVNCS